MSNSALTGLKVIEYGELVSAPYCARILASMGAEVIKVEKPGGDLSRQNGPFPGDQPDPEKSGLFFFLNCDKKGVLLDLEDPGDREKFLDLIRQTDVFIENQLPAKMEKLKIHYEALTQINPALIMASITMFGQGGAYGNWKGYDLNASAGSGVSCVLGYADREPLSLPFEQSDFQAAYNAAAATLACVLARIKTGKGQHVDIATTQVMAYYAGQHGILSRTRGGRYVRRGRVVKGGDIYPSGFFECKDGVVSIATQSSRQWWKFLELMDKKELIKDPLWHDARNVAKEPEAADALFRPWVAQYTRDELMQISQDNGITMGSVNTAEDLVSIEHFKKRCHWAYVGSDFPGLVRFPGLSFKMSETPWQVKRPAPRLGEHNDEVFKAVGEGARIEIPQPAERRKMTGPLEGYRVVDFGWNWAGPMVGQIMGDMGAEVIKVETNTRLDFMRSVEWLRPFFCNINRSKLDITVDLKAPGGVDLIKEVIRKSDMVLDNFRAGVMEKLGLGYEALREVKPDIIVLSMSMAGQTGPLKGMSGFASVATAFGGLESLTGYRDEEGSTGLGSFGHGDVNESIQAVYASLAALHYHEKTGRGQFIDISQIEAVVANLGEPVLDYLWNKRVARPMGNRHTFMAPHGIYPASGEDQWLSVAVGREEEWAGLCKAIGRDDLKDNPKFANMKLRKQNEDELDVILSEWTRNVERYEGAKMFQKEGVAAFPVLCIHEADVEPHFRTWPIIQEIEHPEYGKTNIYTTPWRFNELQGQPKLSPLLGEHNDYVFQELLGLSDEEYKRLKEEQIIN